MEPINELAEALSLAQAEFETVLKESTNPAFRGYKYADMASVIRATQPALAKHGLSIIQFPVTDVAAQQAGVRTILVHKSGQSLESSYMLPAIMAGNRFDAQSVGSAITYARRYAWQAVIGVAGEDDDGNAASTHGQPAIVQGDPEGVTLSPYKQGYTEIKGAGLSIMLSNLTEPEKFALGLTYLDGKAWVVPVSLTFRFKDACFKHDVGVVDMDAGGSQKAIPASTVPSNGHSKVIKGVFPKTGQYGPKSPRNGEMWELRQVIWGDSRYAAWDKNFWPILEAAKGKMAVLDVVEPTAQGKDGMITGIKRIGDTEYEVIEGKPVPVLQREPGE